MSRGRALITGACGLLGAHLMAALSPRYEVIGVDRHPWWGDEPLTVWRGDLEAPGFIHEAVRAVGPELVVHCAALTHVDACERDPARADATNAAATRALARAVPPRCLLVYLSTDSVFNGERPLATEEDPPRPRTVYARSKLDGERAVSEATDNALIIRTNFYGWSSGRKTTAGEWLYRALAAREAVTLFTDLFFTPIYVADLVERLLPLLDGPYRGVLHVGGRDRVSKYAFGARLAELGSFSMAHVQAGSVDQARLIAPRSKDTSLSSRRFVGLTGLEVPAVGSGLERFLADRGRPLSARVAAERHA